MKGYQYPIFYRKNTEGAKSDNAQRSADLIFSGLIRSSMGKHILLVAIGGGAGCVLRFLTSVLTSRYFSGSFPLATFIANVAGCFLIGVFSGLFITNDTMNVQLRLLLITGFCGGYTTFSTFSAENLALINNNNISVAIINIFASVIAGLIAVWLGITIAKN